MNIHFPSVLKAGGLAAVAAGLLGILTVIPIIGQFIAVCYCLGGFLIPVGAGLGYGYFAPGEEDMGESALGGLLAGGAAGFLFGIIAGISALVSTMLGGAGIGEAIAASIVSSIFSICGFGIAGLVFGAVGGVLWPLVQGQRK